MRFPVIKPPKRATSPRLILAVLCLGILVAALDQTVIYGALPKMMPDIHLPITELDRAAWIVTGYLLGYTVAMPLMGRVSDVYGHSRTFILSLIIFMAGSILVVFANGLPWMVGARVVQALGGGALVPIALVITGNVFSVKSRAIALGIIGGVIEAGGALGPFYGAAVAQLLGWRWIFWINLPIGLMAILMVYLYLKPEPRVEEKIDYAGGVLLAAALALFSLGLSQQSDQPHFPVIIGISLTLSIIFFAVFIWRGTQIAFPIIALSLFRDRLFSIANATNFLTGGALIIAMVTIPLLTDTLMGGSAIEGGLRLLRLTIMLSIGAVAGGFACKRFGYRLPTVLGLFLSSAGFFFMSRWTLHVAEPYLTLPLAICGFGFGLVIAPVTTAVTDRVGPGHRGSALSFIVMLRMIGMIVGLSAITSWGMGHFRLITANMSLTDIISLPDKITQSFLALFHDFFLAAAGICLFAVIPAFWLTQKKYKTEKNSKSQFPSTKQITLTK